MRVSNTIGRRNFHRRRGRGDGWRRLEEDEVQPASTVVTDADGRSDECKDGAVLPTGQHARRHCNGGARVSGGKHDKSRLCGCVNVQWRLNRADTTATHGKDGRDGAACMALAPLRHAVSPLLPLHSILVAGLVEWPSRPIQAKYSLRNVSHHP
eukprot:scaffold220784_cov32-Tisochrysis_lutea.AAC.9